MHIASEAADLQVHSDLLPIRAGSIQEIWPDKGILVEFQENIEMPPLGRIRV